MSDLDRNHVQAIRDHLAQYLNEMDDPDSERRRMLRGLGPEWTLNVVRGYVDHLDIALMGAMYDQVLDARSGDVMTVEEFKTACATGFFVGGDGYGNPVKDLRVCTDVDIFPSDVKLIPPDATHIVWYNK